MRVGYSSRAKRQETRGSIPPSQRRTIEGGGGGGGGGRKVREQKMRDRPKGPNGRGARSKI